MNRAAIYQLFRHIPDADDASIDAAVDALEHGSRDELVTKQDVKLLHWMIGILTALMSALHLGTLWMLFALAEQLARVEAILQTQVS